MPQATQNPLRAVFAGIGRILSVTDKVRKPARAEAPAATPAPETAAPESAASDSTVSDSAAPENAAPETAQPEAAEPKAEAPAPAAEAATEVTEPAEAAETPAPEPVVAEATVETPEAGTPEAEVAAEPEAAPAVATTAGKELPLPNYGDLTIASVRARLRTLSVDQLNTLVAYEKANAARADFIAMFERRIAKVESEK